MAWPLSPLSLPVREILYIGNHLSAGGGNPSVAEQLSRHLGPGLRFRLVSRKRNKALRLLEMLRAAAGQRRANGPVVIDVYSTLNFYYALLVAWICRKKNIGYIGVLHGGHLPRRLANNPALCRYLFSGAAALVSPSGYLRDAFQAKGFSVKVIPNPLVLEQYPFRQRGPLRPRLLWVRAFDRTYDPALAIRVLQRLIDAHPDTMLTMVGPDKDGNMNKCRLLAKQLGLVDKIRFTGRLSKKEWIDLSNDFDIFLNTTKADNTPVSVMEALALGLPVVSTNVGGIPWLLKDGVDALLVPPGDEEALAGAVERLLAEPRLAVALSRRGREKAADWDMKKVAAQWREMLLADELV